jgi:tRNA (Thr-GGU) A37 N-methylase
MTKLTVAFRYLANAPETPRVAVEQEEVLPFWVKLFVRLTSVQDTKIQTHLDVYDCISGFDSFTHVAVIMQFSDTGQSADRNKVSSTKF